MIKPAAKRTRLIVDVSPGMRKRIKMAAARRDVSVRRYVEDILEAVVPLDEPLDSERGRLVTGETLRLFKDIRDTVMRGRRFADDSTDLIEQARAERTADL